MHGACDKSRHVIEPDPEPSRCQVRTQFGGIWPFTCQTAQRSQDIRASALGLMAVGKQTRWSRGWW